MGMKHLLSLFAVICVIAFYAFFAPLLVVIKVVCMAALYSVVGGVVIGTLFYSLIMCGVKYDEWKRDRYLKKYSK